MKLKLIESISPMGLEKKLCIEDFLNRFFVSNQKQIEIKRIMIDLFNRLKYSRWIEP